MRFQIPHSSQFLPLGLGGKISLSEKPHTLNYGSKNQEKKRAHETDVCLVLMTQFKSKLSLFFQGALVMLLFCLQ